MNTVPPIAGLPPAFHPLSAGIARELGGIAPEATPADPAAVASAADILAEEAAATAWLKRIEDGRAFDKHARKQYAVDRAYARGDAGDYSVSVPVAGTYVDILTSFLYARDPDVDVAPATRVKAPSLAELMEQVREEVEADPQAQAQAMAQGQSMAMGAMDQAIMAGPQLDQETGAPIPPPDPQMLMQGAMQQAMEDLVRTRAEALLAPSRQAAKDGKQFGATLEVVVSRVWNRAMLRAQMDWVVRSGLTCAVGWIKAAWQGGTNKDPVLRAAINDAQAGVQALESLDLAMAVPGAANTDLQRAERDARVLGLEGSLEVIVARGMVFDFYPGEDVQVAPEAPNIVRFRDGPWLATRTFMTVAAAKIACPDVEALLGTAATYTQKAPKDMRERRDSGLIQADTIDAAAADAYTGGSVVAHGAGETNVAVWEVQDRDSNTVFAVIEGINRYARKPIAPPPSSRFYSMFLFAPIRVDGERHPMSLITRTAPLLDEYNRIRTNYRLARSRAIPKLGFDMTNLDKDQVDRLERGDFGEMIGLKPTVPGSDLSKSLFPLAYNQVDMALYDTSTVRSELEMAWGIQEALSSTIRTAKTATEAEIQQTGTNARTGYMRESLDHMLGELAEYTAELLLHNMDRADAVEIAGEWAVWPEALTAADLKSLANVSIRAGSSGKPDTNADRETWTAVLPVLEKAIAQVAQLRGSDPTAIADAIENVVQITLEKYGVRGDVETFLPAAPSTKAPVPIPGAAPPPGSPPAPAPGM